MTDDLRDLIAAVLKSAAERRGIYRIADFDYPFLADAVIAAGVTMPAIQCPKLLPGDLRIQCEGPEGHSGECW